MLYFPEDISYGSTSGIEYNTTVLATKSGYEQRNKNWSTIKRKYNVIEGAKTDEKIMTLRSFFILADGRAQTFLYKDWMDYKSTELPTDAISDTDQEIGVGDGIKTEFQLIKTYSNPSVSYSRSIDITRPKNNTVQISLNNVNTTNYIIDYNTGIITFDVAPGAGVVIRAGYEYYVPCRFASDDFVVNLDTYKISSTRVDIIEVRE